MNLPCRPTPTLSRTFRPIVALPALLSFVLAMAAVVLLAPAASAAPAAAINGAGKTGVQVQNLDPKLPAEIVAEFYTPQGQLAHSEVRPAVPPGASANFYQGGATSETGAPNLPKACVGAALVEAKNDGRVLAIVNDFTADDAGVPLTAAAYNAVSTARGATRVAVPLFRSRHTAAELSSGIQLMNLDPEESTSATITFFDESGAVIPGDADRNAMIAALGAHTWFAPSLSGIRDRGAVYGSALIESDRPVAVIVSESSLNGGTDTVAYNAVPLPGAGLDEETDAELAARSRLSMSVAVGLADVDAGDAPR